MATRPNAIQDLLDAATADRAHEAAVCAIAAREAVRPLERRRMHRVAALVALTPICRRA